MRFLLLTILMILGANLPAQVPAIQSQKCYGGSGSESLGSTRVTSDGGFLLSGSSGSIDGDLSGNYGSDDAWVVKIDAAGVLQWQRNFGGSEIDVGGDAVETPDGGFLLAGFTYSSDGEMTGNHGGSDLWVIKLNAARTVEWSKCYGGTDDEVGGRILTVGNEGYVIYGATKSINGDVAGANGDWDIWVLSLDIQGNIIWQKCLGGLDADGSPDIMQTSDGGYFIAGSSSSSASGNVLCNTSDHDTWLVKLDMNWNIEWQRCWGGNFSDLPLSAIQTFGGDFVIAGMSTSTDLSGPTTPGFVLKLDPAGNIVRQVLFGGSNREGFFDIKQTPDGGFVVGGFTSSNDGDICLNKGYEDWWIVKLNSQLGLEWQKTIGGSFGDLGKSIEVLPGGGYLMCGTDGSGDGDATCNGISSDFWVVKLGYPGFEHLPAINISSKETAMCPGNAITFVAEITDGGIAPSFQWTINDVNAGTDNDTLVLSSLNDGDIIICILNSSDPCVTNRTVSSNSITIDFDPDLVPKNFLPSEVVLCRGKQIELIPSGAFDSYFWNNNATTPIISVSQPGAYWLKVLSTAGCSGRDTVWVLEKECLSGFYVPSAFTPNNDSRNDVFRPVIGGAVLRYKFTILNRWGQIVFQSTKPGEGWNGMLNGVIQNNNVFIWTCTYQIAGEEMKFEKGTVTIIR